MTQDKDLELNELLRRYASKGWLHDEVFKAFYHDTGFIIAAHTKDGIAQMIRDENPDRNPDYEWLDSAAEFQATMPEGVLTGELKGWRGAIKRKGAGWVFARGALVSAAREAARLGVDFVTGTEGDVKSLIIEDGVVLGVTTSSSTSHFADRVILSAGAAAPGLLDMKDQLRPTAWTLAHIALSPSECALYKNLPVLYNLEAGFFLEPDEERRELKICDEHPGYTNFTTDAEGRKTHTSVPFAKHQIPIASEQRIRRFLADTMPQLRDRAFSFARICWCADTVDRNFLISLHPSLRNLVLAVGGSGHGFMHITSVGGFVVDAMEGKLEGRLKEAFKWRPEQAVNRDWSDVQDRRGGPNAVMDFGDVEKEGGWTCIESERPYSVDKET